MTRRYQCLHLIPLALLLVAIASKPSLAQPDYEETPPSEYVARIVIPEGRARVTIKKPRPRLHLAKIQQPAARLFLNDDDTDYYDEAPDLQVGYRRPELVNQTGQVHNDLSDEVKIRLVLARKRALEAYHKTWG
jgi:hypothetical protein